MTASIHPFPSRVQTLLDVDDFNCSGRNCPPIRSRYSLRVRLGVMLGAAVLTFAAFVMVVRTAVWAAVWIAGGMN